MIFSLEMTHNEITMPPQAIDHVPVWALILLVFVLVLAHVLQRLLSLLLDWLKYLNQRRRDDDLIERR